jgi:hypothetical protein
VRTLRTYSKALGAGLGVVVGVAVLICIFAALMLFSRPEEFKGYGVLYGGLLLFGVRIFFYTIKLYKIGYESPKYWYSGINYDPNFFYSNKKFYFFVRKILYSNFFFQLHFEKNF